MPEGMTPIEHVAEQLGVTGEHLIPYGSSKAKIRLEALDAATPQHGKLVLVSAITPTAAGEGKTTTAIGLADALRRLGHQACLALREPSLGPCLGMKGGGTGGGKAQLTPAEDINLHFTGDFHAVSAAHNFVAAMVDNAVHFGTASLDARRVSWPRVLDMNDRALRRVVVGLGGRSFGVPRETQFDITASSELMAILCLAQGYEDLRERLRRIVVGYAHDRSPVTIDMLEASGATLVLLREALLPNLVQTLEGTPAIVHGGPFANIAHGCSSVLGTQVALGLSDWAITEAGFGFDLGAEKFFDIKCRAADLSCAVVVLVATARALKMHGGAKKSELATPDCEHLRAGLPNLRKHIDNIRAFGVPTVVALNRFPTDSDEEVDVVRACCQEEHVPCAVTEHVARGGLGAEALAQAVIAEARSDTKPTLLYDPGDPLIEKMTKIATRMYGAKSVALTPKAERDVAEIQSQGYGHLPVCMAKTHTSLSDHAAWIGQPHDFDIQVQKVELNAGAGFAVALTRDILRMPGLPKRPRACDIDFVDGKIVGVV